MLQWARFAYRDVGNTFSIHGKHTKYFLWNSQSWSYIINRNYSLTKTITYCYLWKRTFYAVMRFESFIKKYIAFYANCRWTKTYIVLNLDPTEVLYFLWRHSYAALSFVAVVVYNNINKRRINNSQFCIVVAQPFLFPRNLFSL